MKVITGDSVTIIFPFVAEDEEPSEATVQIMAFHDGGVKLWMAGALMDAERVGLLVEALLHAAELAEKTALNDETT